MAIATKEEERVSRRRRIRARVFGTAKRPRLAVFRSNKHLSAQLINDDLGVTLAAVSDTEMKKADAAAIGGVLAKKALAAGLKQAVFDRAGYEYTGVIKKLADGARAGGLKF